MSDFNPEQKYEEYREGFKREIGRLVSIATLYKHLYERKQDRLDAMNIAPAFFGYCLDSFFTTIVVWTNKLLNVDIPSEMSIPKLLNFVEQNIGTFSIKSLQKRKNYPDHHWMLDRDEITLASITEDREKIKQLKCLESINRRRDKFHAHFDKMYFTNPRQLQKDAPLKWNDLDLIVETLTGIYNKYSTAYDGNFQEFKPMNINDVDEVLDILHNYNEELRKDLV